MLTPTGVTLAEYNAAVLGGNATNVRIIFPVQNVTLTNADIAANGGVRISTILNPETDIVMGKAIASEIVINLLNNGQFSGFDWTEEFRVDFGVDISGTTNWVTVGYFTGKKPDRTVRTETIEFTAYDRMLKFDKLADDYLGTVTFPATMETLFQGLCSHVGLSYAAGDENASTMAVSYAENPFTSGTTCRQMLAWIAEATGCYAKITADGKVKLVWYSDHTSDYSIDGDHYFDINIDEATAPVVDTIRVSSSEDESAGAVYPVGTPIETYNIIDNPLLLSMSTANRTTAMTAILARFTTVGAYTPVSVAAIGNWMVEPGDIIEIEYDNGSTLNMPIFGRELLWAGSCDDTYICTGETTRTEMTESAKEQYETGGKLANKYTIQSGVDITAEGVTVSGGKFIKLISGGILDVQATNFVIDSTNQLMRSGLWTFKGKGLYRKTTEGHSKTSLFEIGEATTESGDFKMGIYTGFNERTISSGSKWYYAAVDFKKDRSATKGIRISDMFFPDVPDDGGNDFGGGVPAIVPITNKTGIVGHYNYRFSYMFADSIDSNKAYGSFIKNNLTTTTEGYVLDARQGKALADGKADTNHTHTLSIATNSGTNELTLAKSTKYKLTAGGDSFIFTTPGNRAVALNGDNQLSASFDTTLDLVAGTNMSITYSSGGHFTFTPDLSGCATSDHTHNTLTMNRTSTGNWLSLQGNSTQVGRLYWGTAGAAGTEGFSILQLGNATAKTAANNASGQVRLYNSNGGYARMTGTYGTLGGSSEDYINVPEQFKAAKVWGAVWNDYAEMRKCKTIEAGRCVTETISGEMELTEGRLQAGCKIISDTYGFCIGETAEAKTPIAVCGRVLAYPYKDPSGYHLGDAVCSAPNGTVDIMTREEIKEYPERIVGTISEIPKYDTWVAGSEDNHTTVKVNGRIWVYVR